MPTSSSRDILSVCSHFLFLYSEQFDAGFHLDSVLELIRAAREVRVFPLLELGSRPSRHLEEVSRGLAAKGHRLRRIRVPYEFQRDGREMLRIVPR